MASQREEIETRDDAGLVCGVQVQYDHSGGQGHCWRNCDMSQPGNRDAAEEIAAEIINGGVESCDDYVASNGCHYRW